MAKNMKWWEWLIPFWPAAKNLGSVVVEGAKGFNNLMSSTGGAINSAQMTEDYNNHGLGETDSNGVQQVEVNSADPTSSASNVINYDPNKSAAENMLGYAQANNSASAYNTYLQNQWNQEMSNTAISRAIADAEANGISKYQLFQSGNMAASTPSSGSSMYQSYENAMNRREGWNEKELAALTAIALGIMNSASKLIGSIK